MTGFVKQYDVKKEEEEAKETWWKRLKTRKRSLTLFTTISITVGISALIALVYVVHYMKPEITIFEDIQYQYEKTVEIGDNQENLCTSAECIHTASRLFTYMNKSVDPCDNFYEFACGNYLRNANLRKYSSAVDSFNDLDAEVEEQLINMIDESIQNNEIHPFQVIKKFYRACMDGSYETNSWESMKSIFDYLGGWPVLDYSWPEADFNWNNLDHKLANLGYGPSYFLHIVIDGYFGNSTNAIFVGEPIKIMKDASNSTVFAYYDYLVSIAALFGADYRRAAVEMMEVIEFDLKLREIYPERDEKYTSMNIVQLETEFPSIPWREYMADLPLPDTQLAKDDMVFNVYENYIRNFVNIIEQIPKKVQANYMMWRVLADSLPYLTGYMNLGNPDYIEHQSDYRWGMCRDQIIMRFPAAYEAMYINKYFNENSRKAASEMVADIRNELNEILMKVDWMDEETRRYALEKSNNMEVNIGYPYESMDTAKLEEYYKGLEMNAYDFLPAILEVDRFTKRNFYKYVTPAVDEKNKEWRPETYSTTASYALSGNSIHLPAGSLQSSFFDVQRPKYMNYGAIGYLIAAKIIRGFNEEGSRHYINESKLIAWWTSQTGTLFSEKAQCFFDSQIPPNSFETILFQEAIEAIFRENNDGGVKIAYLAYRHWLERNGVEPKLPGLDFSPQQMFWISAANMWCPKYNVIDEILGRSKEEFRVSNFISNSEYFAKDFNCPKKSPMNPSKSCQIW